MDEASKRKILKNTVAVIGSRFGFLLIGFVLTPYILGTIGNEQYGLWVVVLAVVGFVGIADFGFGTSFVKYVAEYDARGEPEKINGVLAAGLLIYGGLGALILLVSWPLRDDLLELIGVQDPLMEDARFVLGIGILVWVLGNVIRVYRSVIDGLQRMEVSMAIMLVAGVFFAAGTVLFLEAGWGIRGLALNQLLVLGIEGLLTVTFAHRLQHGLRIETRYVREQFGPMFRFGMNLQFSRIAILVNSQFDKLLINSVMGTAHVIFYDLGNRLTSVASSFPVMLLHPLLPAASELNAREQEDDAYQLFARASKYVSLLALFLLTGVAAMAEPIVQLWVGPGYSSSAQVTGILAVGALFSAVAGPVSPFVQGMGRPDIQRNAEMLNLALNVVLSIWLISLFGLLGAAVGTACALTLSSTYYLVVFHRLLNRSLGAFLQRVLLRPTACALAAGLVSHVVVAALGVTPESGRLQALAICGLSGAAFGATFSSLAILSKAVDSQDLSLARGLIGSVLGRGRRSGRPQ